MTTTKIEAEVVTYDTKTCENIHGCDRPVYYKVSFRCCPKSLLLCKECGDKEIELENIFWSSTECNHCGATPCPPLKFELI